jgi:hypothetical protein
MSTLAELRRAHALFVDARTKEAAAGKAFDAMVDKLFAEEFTAAEWRSFYKRNEALWKRRYSLRRDAYATGLLAHAIKILGKRK